MERTERLRRIQQLLVCNRSSSIDFLVEQLGVSRATVKRDIAFLRDRMGAPLVWDRTRRGYILAKEPAQAAFELPGVWFSAGEIYALLAAEKILAEIEPGILAERTAPLRDKLTKLLGVAGKPAADVVDRVRLLSLGRRLINPRHFSLVALALLERKRVDLAVYVRGRDEETRRTTSPQRLVHYRDNWYLDAWCHLRAGLRTFPVENIRRAEVLDERCLDVPEVDLDAHFTSGYGIFAGRPTETAVLRFSPTRARWVRGEIWHPAQTVEELPGGGLRLGVPFSDHRELVMDILKHGPEVVVESPESLREVVAAQAKKILAAYD